jgi:hypothetical protein
MIEFFSVVVGDEGRYDGCGGVDTEETAALKSQ